MSTLTDKKGFGTAPVFFTAISTILGAILFLRFGMAVGNLGFYGALGIIILGHMITIPTALAISEIATNKRVEGGGEYFIISRSFGLNIGATIGMALYFSQAISVAFYVIAFTEAFEPFFNWMLSSFDIALPRQVISVPAILILAYIVLQKGSDMGVKTLYVVVAVLFISLTLFFVGRTYFFEAGDYSQNFVFNNRNQFFVWFAICFPAFTGMTAGVGLSGDLKNPTKSIPRGTMWGTICGMLIYIFIIYKFSISLTPEEMSSSQLAMANVAVLGAIIIPLGLGASTISSAIGSVLVAPRTIQALAVDKSFPSVALNRWLAKGKGETNEPYNATLITIAIALVFVLMGEVDFVAQIISMFFMITYGSLCLISFLNHFGASPSYRPQFKSHWAISLIGFLLSMWVMFKINAAYTIAAYVVITLLYLYLNYIHKERGGLQKIFLGALFQLSRRIQLYMQKHRSYETDDEEWRPSAICISSNSFKHSKVFDLMKWISYKHGFGTYFHFLKGYYSKNTTTEAKQIVDKLIDEHHDQESSLYVDCMISPSYTTAIAQAIQSPSISGMENNMIVFEYRRNEAEAIEAILDNISLTRAGDYDVCVFSDANKNTHFKNGIHIWIRSIDILNANLMILLGFIILSHPDWKKGFVKIFSICDKEDVATTRKQLQELVQTGRLPITLSNIEIIAQEEDKSSKSLIKDKSSNAGLTIIGFREEQTKHSGSEVFEGFDDMGDILFVNANRQQTIE
ncbi:amino acid permease [Carboxylicivirga mesophila]|uniref:Amino acid permease n=1 Tax=Carboxylicivirga mesophila TaxID=1166478 RepID=A0ABS5K7N0_9BACT|nr:amino acid permease [Carboxylicivirga mesophila]MBS2210378.1 amino acid permease [Carboxylicivirga mesophila]